MVRLPKESGGHRLIALIQTIVRIWGRLRRPLSKAWAVANSNDAFWGSRAGATSVDAAFSHNVVRAGAAAAGGLHHRADRHVQVFRDDYFTLPGAAC
eukprot:9093449-Pyramimonas_sp.AAC.1